MRGEVFRLLEKDGVHREEVIATAVSSASKIVFLGDTKISLGPNTRLTLDQCGLAATVLPDGSMTPPGPPPHWAISATCPGM